MPDRGESAARTYEERAARFARQRDECRARSRRLSHLRFAAFAAAVLPHLLPMNPAAWTQPGWWAVSGAFLLLFLLLIARHKAVNRRCRWLDELVRLNREGTARLARDWGALPEPFPDDKADSVANDLDLFGRASLFSLLGTVATRPGRETLRGWLLQRPEAEDVRERQGAVADLAPRIDLREEISVRGRLMGNNGGLEGFFRWAEEETRIPTVIIWAARILPALPLTLIVLNVLGVVPYLAWMLALAANLAVGASLQDRVHALFDRADLHERGAEQYAAILRRLRESRFESDPLERLRSRIANEGEPADTAMKRLHRLILLSEVRHSMAYLPIQAFTLWDVHVAHRLGLWQKRVGGRTRGWFAALGTADALSALAALRFENPGWAFPDLVDDEPPILSARGLGHPLLPDDVRVGNDVQVGPPGTFLYVTGSNMSGKSTLLRAIGTNVMLARAGGPVCASQMRLPCVALETSMQVHDSLAQGLSQFMAELQRLKQVVEASRRIRAGEGPLLYLLDDILQGTNTAERRTAVRVIIRHLLSERAIGCVTSHDLTLAESPELRQASRPVHFTETVLRAPEGATLSFDYRLRPGIATSKNALELLKLVGLGIPPDGAGAAGSSVPTRPPSDG